MDDIKKTHYAAAQKASDKLLLSAEALRSALAEYEGAIENHLRAQLRLCDTPAEALFFLTRTVTGNKATASGGPLQPRNMIDALQREAATALLPHYVNKIL